ncbi:MULTISPECIES: protein translocase subunit SecD [Chromobacterium]|uniref:Protein translocase subunit SecD n=2 Tax=Chromobacterium TaxID=535 RepID=A0A1W0CEW4_9NEIS|nr:MULTISPECIES: protein translocase subunit SecD [Chromobacterium]AXT45861.1 protein translocase subunit SecD [Chromobacterium rhizoryzae]MBK0413973.1 protein translocase subunit SecD [Chromobacterium haemolyticum]MBO0415340.1 protein translocase subunit SecD [Chromobacterium haemolyticum]MBO0498601.1 protein translocase subunit SecD [Chromobacterium haemolyticum]MDH0340672.1 protein translocase subunit SecD [Chromobacterium haemolyticum]
MNRYPLWKYLVIAVALILSAIYTLPNFYGETPAVQVSSSRQSIPVDTAVMTRVEEALKAQNISPDGLFLDGASLRVRFKDADTQLKARDAIQHALGDNYIIALNLLSASPAWLTSLKAHPMFLGLDLRGGVHFLLEVDMKAAIDKTMERYAGDLRRELKNKKVRYGAIKRNGNTLEVQLRDADTLKSTQDVVYRSLPSLTVKSDDSNYRLTLTLKPEEITKIQGDAVKQNITTLHNRVNELGTSEPIIQQNGPNRIVVQLPGIQDTARAKDIIGRTATLEVRMVEDDPSKMADAMAGNVPAGYELLDEASSRGVQKILVRKDVELTGDNINDAQAGFDENGAPAVHINLDSAGASIFRQVTAENIGKRMAMVLVEKGRAEVVTAPVIRSEIGGGRVQISGSMNPAEANDTALLLRAGSLAAPMNIVEERTVGPSLGQENIEKGFHATLWGFAAIATFMILYYGMFGVFSALSLAINVFLLLALLSMIQATLTLPGIAAIALALGMAIDANVLINERIREELRNGVPPHSAIQAGYTHAWHTILDSNVTTLIAGLALLIFGSGAVRGFAVVHSLGILTSMFSAVVVSRGLVNLWYGRRRKLTTLAIGQVWKPENKG